MKLKIICLTVLALSFCSISHASIVSASWGADGDGAIVCTNWWSSQNNTKLSMEGLQYGQIGHMVGDIQTDTTADPTLTLGSTVNNDTGFAWNTYEVNVTMQVPFTFVSPPPTVSNPPNNDWFAAGVAQPVPIGGGEYEGGIFFTGPSSVGIGGLLDFGYSINFGSSINYSFTQEMIPNGVLIPEPSALALVGLGGLVLVGRFVRQSRKGA